MEKISRSEWPLNGLEPSSLLIDTLALTLSVWGHKTHEILLVVYLLEAVWLLAYTLAQITIHVFLGGTGSVPDWLWKINPYALVFAPYSSALYSSALFIPSRTNVAPSGISIAATRSSMSEPFPCLFLFPPNPPNHIE